MNVEQLFDTIEADREAGGEYDNNYEVLCEDGTGRRYTVNHHRTGVDHKGLPCLMLEIRPE